MQFCRFGFDERLTLDDVRELINRSELKAKDLLLVDDATDWKPAGQIEVLQAYFPEEAPAVIPPRAPTPRRAVIPRRAPTVIPSRADGEESPATLPHRAYFSPPSQPGMAEGSFERFTFFFFGAVVFIFTVLKAGELPGVIERRHWTYVIGVMVSDYRYAYEAKGVRYQDQVDNALHRGDQLPVYYDPDHPGVSTTDRGDIFTTSVELLLWLLGLGFCVLGVVKPLHVGEFLSSFNNRFAD